VHAQIIEDKHPKEHKQNFAHDSHEAKLVEDANHDGYSGYY
jgi:hypothetical protein